MRSLAGPVLTPPSSLPETPAGPDDLHLLPPPCARPRLSSPSAETLFGSGEALENLGRASHNM